MRIFQFWSELKRSVVVDGKPHPVRVFGGSNVSPEAAVHDAEGRLRRVQARIAGRVECEDAASYEADIREEILWRIDDRNVVTRNRYGAAVLNSSEVLFIDIDQPRTGFWDFFRGPPRGAHKTERIVAQVKALVLKTPELRGFGVRLYETHSGVRAIVTGRHFDPKAESTAQLLRRFNADWLYSALCRRQGCFRARLTPKPYRMKCRTHKVVFPRASAAEESEHRAWVTEYDQLRRPYATCRLICSIGHDVRDAIVDWHDRETGAGSGRKLA